MINFLTNSSFYALCKIASITTGMLLCMTIFYYILIHEWRVRKMMPNLKTFNSSPTLPVIGSLHHIAFNINKGATKLLQIFNHYKLPLVGWIVRSPFVAVGSYEDIQIVMNNSLERDFLGLLRKVATNSTLLLQGEQWQKSRHIATPAFSYGAMQQYIPVFNEYASFLVKKLQQFSNNNEAIEITNHVFSMNIDATIQNMTGYKLRSLETENTEVIKLLFKLLQMESMRFAFPPLFPEFMYKIYLFFSGKDKLYKKIHAISKKILKDKLNQYEMNKKREKNQDTHETDDQDSKSLINLLLKVHKIDATLTEKHIRDELIIMITLGYESISLTVCAMLLMLAMNPDIQVNNLKTETFTLSFNAYISTITFRQRYTTKL
uniref:Cytochrome P450 3638J1 short isoform n=1 Tax=Maconellicoccus hirsutus TaxID=177089 RepID=A0AAT9UTU4_MACHI